MFKVTLAIAAAVSAQKNATTTAAATATATATPAVTTSWNNSTLNSTMNMGGKSADMKPVPINNSTKGNDPKDVAKMSNNININFGNDVTFSYSSTSDFKITKMKAKFMDYFKYAMVQTQGKKNSVGMDNCQEDCGMQLGREMCCTTIQMYAKDSSKEFVQYECMDRAVMNTKQGMWLDEFYYEMECRGAGTSPKPKGWRSGATHLAGAVISAAAVVSTLA